MFDLRLHLDLISIGLVGKVKKVGIKNIKIKFLSRGFNSWSYFREKVMHKPYFFSQILFFPTKTIIFDTYKISSSSFYHLSYTQFSVHDFFCPFMFSKDTELLICFYFCE